MEKKLKFVCSFNLFLTQSQNYNSTSCSLTQWNVKIGVVLRSALDGILIFLEINRSWLSLLHNFIQQSPNSGSAQVQILLEMCRRFAMVRFSHNGLGWKYGVNTFRRSTINMQYTIDKIIIGLQPFALNHPLLQLECIILWQEGNSFCLIAAQISSLYIPSCNGKKNSLYWCFCFFLVRYSWSSFSFLSLLDWAIC